MIKKILLLFLLVNQSTLFAQSISHKNINPIEYKTSIGFKDTDNLNPILDFTLPDWGYHSFYIRFKISGNGNYDHSVLQDQFFRFDISPFYTIYHESEQRIYEFKFGKRWGVYDNGFRYKISKNLEYDEYDEYDEYEIYEAKSFSKSISYEDKIYLFKKLFFHSEIDTNIKYSKA